MTHLPGPEHKHCGRCGYSWSEIQAAATGPSTEMRLLNCRALLAEAEKMIRDKPEAQRSVAESNLLFDIEAMKGRC